MVEGDPNLFWFGLVLWVAGTAFALSLFGSKTQQEEAITCQYEADPMLRDRLATVGITYWSTFQRKTGLTPRQLLQLRQGKLDNLTWQQMQRVAQLLNWTLEEFLQNYDVSFPSLGEAFQQIAKLHQKYRQLLQEKQELEQQAEQKQVNLEQTSQQAETFATKQQQLQEELQTAQNEVTQLQQQCRRLRNELQQQSQQLPQDIKQATFEQLQTLLMNYPTATVMAQSKPALPAKNFIPLFTPLKNLLQSWGYEPIGSAWEKVSFDPQLHQPDSPDIQAGEPVYIRFVGYREGDRILCPAKVSRYLPNT
ncbi:helix-turn-helix domain-containing protein [Spirulina sp. CS-785/01]|uniref:helix-turn-helix domain-containing protein n=1 Tax=Spirulina sp. CS-785/01 TaxID=3021716 RepID=UPI00232D6B62|nr:helix-turn-helix domain-containing protein [Spirulina sp. CS-785/01]MDB9315485.1 helix-turn-helix domain-containing protein [Spirulina sp. CS-785/01]